MAKGKKKKSEEDKSKSDVKETSTTVNENRSEIDTDKNNKIQVENSGCSKNECIFWFDLYDFVMLLLIIFHVLLNPYTKVEETFITNNMYDHLVYGNNIKGQWFETKWNYL